MTIHFTEQNGKNKDSSKRNSPTTSILYIVPQPAKLKKVKSIGRKNSDTLTWSECITIKYSIQTSRVFAC